MLGHNIPDDSAFAPGTQQQTLRDLWAEILGLGNGAIQAQSNFFALGGDSATAMRLAAAVRRRNIELPCKDIMISADFAEMAARMTTSASCPTSYALVPYQLLKGRVSVNALKRAAALMCNVEENEIEDIYPATPTQKFWMNYTSSYPDRFEGPYGCADYSVFSLSPDVDNGQFTKAWSKVLTRNETLRTRMIEYEQAYYQVVTKAACEILHATSLSSYLELHRQKMLCNRDRYLGFQPGEPLVTSCLVDDVQSGNNYFVYSISHAICDAWMANLLFSQLETAYLGKALPPTLPKPNQFVHYLRQLPWGVLNEWWRTELQQPDCQPLIPHKPNCKPNMDGKYTEWITIPQLQPDVNWPAMIYAAWALLLFRRTGRKDVIFGLGRPGRDIPVDDVDNMVAMLSTRVPLRISRDEQQQLGAFLRGIQQKLLDMTAVQHCGVAHIRTLSDDARLACDSSLRLIVRSGRGKAPGERIGMKPTHSGSYISLPEVISLDCTLDDTTLSVTVHYDGSLASRSFVGDLVGDFASFLTHLCATSEDQTIGTVLSAIRSGLTA